MKIVGDSDDAEEISNVESFTAFFWSHTHRILVGRTMSRLLEQRSEREFSPASFLLFTGEAKRKIFVADEFR